jgi:hypothetical protein
MTEIIPGLQGELPPHARKGYPYVGGKYDIINITNVNHNCYVTVLLILKAVLSSCSAILH